MLQSVLCITTNKYLVRVLVVLLHVRFSVVGPIPFLLAAIFFSVHPYIGSTTVLPDYTLCLCHASACSHYPCYVPPLCVVIIHPNAVPFINYETCEETGKHDT